MSTVHPFAPWICLGMIHAAACVPKGGADGTGESSGTTATGATMDGGTTQGLAVTTGDPGGPNGPTGPDGSTGSTGAPPVTTGPTTTVGTTTGGAAGTTSDASATDAATTDGTTTGDTGEASGSSSGGMLPMECGAPLLDFFCLNAGEEEMLITLDTAAIVPPLTTQDVPLDVSPCVDETARVAGLVVDVELQDSCLWSMELSIVCPSGQALALTAMDMCAPCGPVAAYHAVFRQSAEVNCIECDLLNDPLCIQAPFGGDYCTFLDGCQFEVGKPWALRVTTGDTQVTIPTVALHLAFEAMP